MSIIDHIMDVIKIRLTIVSFDSEINRLIPGKKVFLGSYPPRDKPLAILILSGCPDCRSPKQVHQLSSTFLSSEQRYGFLWFRTENRSTFFYQHFQLLQYW